MNRKWISSLILVGVLTISIGVSNTSATASLRSDMDNQINSLSISADWFYESGQDGAELGYAVSTAGDVNGDGYDDILMGSPLFTPPPPNGIYREGATFGFYGGPGGLKLFPDWSASGGKQGSRFGSAISTAGDINNDGFDDVIVGAEEYKKAYEGYSGEPKSGAAFVFLGGADGLSETAIWMQTAEAAEISFGFAVASAGDVNGDGFDDVIIGAPHFQSSSEHNNEGKVYLYLGSADGLAKNPDWTYECNLAESSCGYSVGSAGDVNNDGYEDIVVGAPHYDIPTSNNGATLIFLGSESGLGGTADFILKGETAQAWFGESVASAGDVNGDGFSDIIIGASHLDKDEEHQNYGVVFLYLGSTSGPGPSFDWFEYGTESYSGFGHSVQSAGDINRDGFSDVLIGAYLFGQNGGPYQPNEGAVFLYLGGPSGLASSPSWTTFGNKAEAWFGFSTGAAGDVNGDGGMDIIVGAPKYRFDEKTVMGRSFVYLNTLEKFSYDTFLPVIIQK